MWVPNYRNVFQRRSAKLKKGKGFSCRMEGSILESQVFRKPSVEFAFLVILLMWDPHFKSSEIVIPR